MSMALNMEQMELITDFYVGECIIVIWRLKVQNHGVFVLKYTNRDFYLDIYIILKPDGINNIIIRTFRVLNLHHWSDYKWSTKENLNE